MTAVFVFGSNLAGRHGAGAALEAQQRWGAVYGCGEGRQGASYAIPTKDERIQTLPLERIAAHVESFLEHARIMSGDSFLVTAIGCGLAGYEPPDIAPMFAGAPRNVFLSGELVAWLL